MKKIPFLPGLVFVALLLFAVACSKNNNDNTAVTVSSISGTYKLSALVWQHGSITFNVYDSLDACEKDNLIKLNSDLSADFVDAGTVCAPPEDDNGSWKLSGDSLYLDDDGAKIKSFNGKTLVLTGYLSSGGMVDSTTTATTTLTKQ